MRLVFCAAMAMSGPAMAATQLLVNPDVATGDYTDWTQVSTAVNSITFGSVRLVHRVM